MLLSVYCKLKLSPFLPWKISGLFLMEMKISASWFLTLIHWQEFFQFLNILNTCHSQFGIYTFQEIVCRIWGFAQDSQAQLYQSGITRTLLSCTQMGQLQIWLMLYKERPRYSVSIKYIINKRVSCFLFLSFTLRQ